MGFGKAAAGATARPTRIYPGCETVLARGGGISRAALRPSWYCRLPRRACTAHLDTDFTWKFDPALFDGLEMGIVPSHKFKGLSCCAALLLGEHATDEAAPRCRL